MRNRAGKTRKEAVQMETSRLQGYRSSTTQEGVDDQRTHSKILSVFHILEKVKPTYF